MKKVDKIISGVAKLFSYCYIEPIVRGIRYFRRLLFGYIYEKKLNSGSGLRFASNSFEVNLKGQQYIEVGKNLTIRNGLRLEAIDRYLSQSFKPKIIIGNQVDMGVDCHIGAIDLIEIGNNVLMGSKIYITDHSHGNIGIEETKISPANRNLVSKGPVVIGNNVWIGDGVVILSGVSIGEGTIIGANSVVTKNIPANCVIGGAPARIIRFLA